jgi:hypothetical protein
LYGIGMFYTLLLYYIGSYASLASEILCIAWTGSVGEPQCTKGFLVTFDYVSTT